MNEIVDAANNNKDSEAKQGMLAGATMRPGAPRKPGVVPESVEVSHFEL